MRGYSLVQLLADGQAKTLGALARSLHMEVAGIEPLLCELEAAGLVLEREPGGRVALESPLELLSRERIVVGLTPQAGALVTELDLHAAIDSTNAEALRRLQKGAAAGLVVTAEQQTAGRGRRGRRWVSPFAGNLYVSAVWVFSGGPEVMRGLSLAVGVAVAEALAENAVEDVQLKWPNDILCHGAKLGGILVEATGGASGPTGAVVGIGLNLKLPEQAAAAIDQPWTDLQSLGGGAGRNALLASVLNHLMPLMAAYESSGLEPWRAQWLSRDAYRGRDVCLLQGQRQVAGRMLGIGPAGELVLDVGGIEQRFDGGEVSLRALT